MAIFHGVFLLSTLLLFSTTLGLQVTPNSPCALECLDDPTADISDPNMSNTYPKDIVCEDADYANTTVGRKFEACVNCLRNSTVTDAGENDQSWFLYNIRYAFDSCIYGFTKIPDAQSTPCSMDSACGPLQEFLEDGDLVPGNETTYGYCSAGNKTLLGSSLDGCISCLQATATETYLANFVTVLQAGCVQQPQIGVTIGIRGNIFSSNLLKITYPGDVPGSSSHNKKNGIPEAAIIGMVSGLIVVAVLVAAASFICHRKRRHPKSMRRLTSPLDPRFGSKTISTPSSGAYSDPGDHTPKFGVSTVFRKKVAPFGLQLPKFSRPQQHSTGSCEGDESWQDAHTHFEASQAQQPSYTTIPTHQAYIPSIHGTKSMSVGIKPGNAFQMSQIPASKSFPSIQPPPLAARPDVVAPAPTLESTRLPPPALGSRIKAVPPPIKLPHRRPKYAPEQVKQVDVTQHQPQATLEYVRPAQKESQDERTQLSKQRPPRPHAAPYPVAHHPIMTENAQPSRNNSISGYYQARSERRNGRNRSASRGRRRDRSPSRNGPRFALAGSDEPIAISGPMIKHGHRFDFERAEENAQLQLGNGRGHAKADASPLSAESGEVWPGVY